MAKLAKRITADPEQWGGVHVFVACESASQSGQSPGLRVRACFPHVPLETPDQPAHLQQCGTGTWTHCAGDLSES